MQGIRATANKSALLGTGRVRCTTRASPAVFCTKHDGTGVILKWASLNHI